MLDFIAVLDANIKKKTRNTFTRTAQLVADRSVH
jgi:hypothetical protein